MIPFNNHRFYYSRAIGYTANLVWSVDNSAQFGIDSRAFPFLLNYVQLNIEYKYYNIATTIYIQETIITII